MTNTKVIPFPGTAPLLYILTDDNRVVSTDDYGKWAFCMEARKSAPLKTRTLLHSVQTCFIGIDAKRKAHRPELFETFVIGPMRFEPEPPFSNYQDAARGHKRTVQVAIFYEATLAVLLMLSAGASFSIIMLLGSYISPR